MNVTYIRRHKVLLSVALFLGGMALIHWIKPSLVYDDRGRFRQFGIGYRKDTILPIWVVSIVLAILSYLTVLNLAK